VAALAWAPWQGLRAQRRGVRRWRRCWSRSREAGCPEVEIFVRLGVQVPTIGDLPRSIGVVRMGRLAEDAGADSLLVSDHILMVEDALDGGRPV
jgi:hypothetical protein